MENLVPSLAVVAGISIAEIVFERWRRRQRDVDSSAPSRKRHRVALILAWYGLLVLGVIAFAAWRFPAP